MFFFTALKEWVVFVFALVSMVHLVTWLIPYLLTRFRKPVDVKAKYGAEWALVTGGSSGIGRAIVRHLASQGLNVVIAAVDDKLLKDTTAESEKDFPKRKFRAIGVDLSDVNGSYMDKIIAGTQDISVQVVFCNAGYIMTGCFRKFDVSAHIKNMECNATHGLRVSHHFLNRMADEGKKGCIVFTSSPAGCIPNALAVMYGSTKAFVSNFGASLAIEAAANGVDVHVFHPSPVHSRFLDGKTKLSAFDAAYKFAWTPEEVPLEVFKAIGSPSLLWDVGFFAVFTRYLTKVLDFNAFAGIMKLFGPWMGDYQKLVVPPKEKKN